MFPVTHIYYYSTLFDVTDAGVIGSVYPDTRLLTGLKWSETHRGAVDLYQSLDDDARERFLPFFQGLFTHSVDSSGLDYYGDEKYRDYERGYAYYRALEIIPDVVRACKIPPEMGHWKAHNFIEMGIESLIGKNNPRIASWIERANKDRSLPKELAGMLSVFYRIPADVIENSIVKFVEFMQPSGDPMDLGRSYSRVLFIRHGISDADPAEIARVIRLAGEVVKDEYSDFLAGCRENFIRRWKDLPGIKPLR